MNPWAIVIGGKRDGKDEALLSVVRQLRSRGLRVSGCVQAALRRGDEVEGYELIDVRTEERVTLARSGSSNPTICDLEFVASSFERARTWARAESDVVVLPVGRIELGEDGHWPTIMESLERSGRTVILSIRPHLLAPLVLRLPDPFASLELPTNPDAIVGFAEEIVQSVSLRTSPL